MSFIKIAIMIILGVVCSHCYMAMFAAKTSFIAEFYFTAGSLSLAGVLAMILGE